MKKYTISIVICTALCAFIIFMCFCWGYKIPQKDKHEEWPEYPKHSNKDLVIQLDKKEIFNLTTIPKSDLLLIYYKNPDSANNTYGVLSRIGKLVIDLGYYTTIYIDEHHNRLIAENSISHDSSIFAAYDAKTFKRIPTRYRNVKIDQSFDTYLKTERRVKTDSKGDKHTQIDLKSGEAKALFKEKYIKLANILNGLHELYPFDDDQRDGYRNSSYVKTDRSGVIYRFDYSDKESIEMLCKNFFNDVFRDDQSKPTNANHISTPDSSIIVANTFDPGFGIFTRGTAGSGGGNGPLLDPKFEQTYLDYYQLRLHQLKTFFKQDNRKDHTAVYSVELNEPKGDNDTLVFLTESRLYYLYKVNKKK